MPNCTVWKVQLIQSEAARVLEHSIQIDSRQEASLARMRQCETAVSGSGSCQGSTPRVPHLLCNLCTDFQQDILRSRQNLTRSHRAFSETSPDPAGSQCWYQSCFFAGGRGGVGRGGWHESSSGARVGGVVLPVWPQGVKQDMLCCPQGQQHVCIAERVRVATASFKDLVLQR